MAESDDMVVTDVSPPSSRRSDEVVGAEPQSEAAAAASAEPRARRGRPPALDTGDAAGARASQSHAVSIDYAPREPAPRPQVASSPDPKVEPQSAAARFQRTPRRSRRFSASDASSGGGAQAVLASLQRVRREVADDLKEADEDAPREPHTAGTPRGQRGPRSSFTTFSGDVRPSDAGFAERNPRNQPPTPNSEPVAGSETVDVVVALAQEGADCEVADKAGLVASGKGSVAMWGSRHRH